MNFDMDKISKKKFFLVLKISKKKFFWSNLKEQKTTVNLHSVSNGVLNI
jgi:hypothetical protein